MFYATLDTEADRISQNAYIAAFATRDEAVAYLLSRYDATEWDHASAEIGVGRYGDCWIKVHSVPGDAEPYFAPFAADDLYIARPGQHPGGRAWWIEPRPEVLVLEKINERSE